ncbi:hypothetical protein MMC21_005575 [Puttea exsequens]|nr:hypothetical protein [Puttea exsequens]
MPMAVSMAEPLSPPGSIHDDTKAAQLEKIEKRQRKLRDLLSFSKWRNQEDRAQCVDPAKQGTPPQTPQTPPTPTRPGIGGRLSRRGWVGMRRSQTFKRQEDEQRKNLEPVEPSKVERRDQSKVRQRALSAAPLPPRQKYRDASVPPDFQHHYSSIDGRLDQNTVRSLAGAQTDQVPPPPPPPPQPPPQDPPSHHDADAQMSDFEDDDGFDDELMEELKRSWILNLSMHFRDKSPREKFFITYAETSDRWRRVTVSCDYRDAPVDSLESDLQNLHYQKDKSARIYESIRMSLPDIQFYDTVTNLKLETKDDRLHVHVTEDMNEIIPYPPVHLVNHLPHIRKYPENELHFDEHMSGFVYRVSVGTNTWIKKEIPGPDSVDEFLYEVNALSRLVGSQNVIQLKGLVVDNIGRLIKGLLLGYADKGALVDIIYDSREGHLPRVEWSRREKWAKQILQGLSNIHEAGYVQGDFTMSNIVIDEKDEARIIDINRRGCPVGWESPEMVPLVESGQRLSMYIGVKSDLFQLGMVLWALAMEKDEPERAPRPLSLRDAPNEIPQYYRDLTATCLSEDPNNRFAAKDLLAMFNSPGLFAQLRPRVMSNHANGSNLGDATLIHYGSAVAEVDSGTDPTVQSRGGQSYGTNGASYPITPEHSHSNGREAQDPSEEDFRGRRPPVRSRTMGIPSDGSPALSISRQGTQVAPVSPRHFLFNRDNAVNASEGQNDEDEAGDSTQIVPISPTGDGDWQQITMGGNPYLVHRDTLEDFDEEEEEPSRHSPQPHRSVPSGFDHMDSGLGDMDFAVSEIGAHVNQGAERAHGAGSAIAGELEIENRGEEATETAAGASNVDQLNSAPQEAQRNSEIPAPTTMEVSTAKNLNSEHKPDRIRVQGNTEDLGAKHIFSNTDTALQGSTAPDGLPNTDTLPQT